MSTYNPLMPNTSDEELEFIDGSPYLEGLGGIAAILRYSTE